MGQIMFDTGDPCLVWLIARYMCVYAFFRRFDSRRRGTPYGVTRLRRGGVTVLVSHEL